jgi:hypothetical protein
MRARFLSVLTVVAVLVMLSPASAFFESGSTGADGAFSPSCTPTPCTVTVTLPASGVFNYTTVSVPSGVTVKYTRNAANTPVTILATGSVTITGTIDLSGENGGAGASATQLGPNRGLGGPGGYDGGNGTNGLVASKGGDGLGPGGGVGGDASTSARSGGGGGFLTSGGSELYSSAGGPAYGTPILVPLVGGSGGGGGAGWLGNTAGGGGGGGGAILIASGTSAGATTITLNGSIKSKGGLGGTGAFSSNPPYWGGAGSGGAVRLVAETIAGTGSIEVTGGAVGYRSPGGGFGRIRVEAASYTAALVLNTGNPPASVASIASTPWAPTLTNHPTLTITSVGGVSAPSTLTGSFATPDFVLAAGTSSPTVNFAASNIPLSTTLSVVVKGHTGSVISTATSGGLSGTVASSTASASVTIPTDQPSVISATASFTVIADAGGGPIYADGEPVERVVVTAAFGGGSQVTYVTASGREVVLAAAR